MGILIKARKYMNKHTLINLYNSFIFPYLIYCVEIWGNACDTHLDPLVKMQNTILRIITFSPPYQTSSAPLYINNKILPLKKLVVQRIGLQMYKYSIGTLPPVIQNLFTVNESMHHYNTRQKKNLRQHVANREYMYRNFSYVGVYVWNYIKSKSNIDVHLSYHTFKRKLKEHLLYNDNLNFRLK